MLASLAAAFTLSSAAFPSGGAIPVRYTCDGAGISPPLRWTAPPPHTAWLSLTVFDPDAPNGGFLHWRIEHLPASARSLAPGSHLGGLNGAGQRGWTGPCPPPGATHHYRFELRAVSPAGKLLAVARLIGLYRR
jgi:Raf kinase inhibitor-like YbhB/YbcL family protein